MTRFVSPLQRDGQLLLVEVVGPRAAANAHFVLDTGASATTLTPALIEKIGYTPLDGYDDASVSTAVGEERGYWLRVAELTMLGICTSNFAVTVFPLGAKVEGLVGMNFLRHFDFEVRPDEPSIALELIRR